MAASDSPLLGRFFQLGYVVRDLDRAMPAFQQRFGVPEFQVVPGQDRYPHTRRIALGYLGTVMFELIDASPDHPSIYLDYIPDSDVDARFHHVGLLTDDAAGTLRRLEAMGYDIPFKMSHDDIVEVLYADKRAELGHYVEYIQLHEQGRAWFSSVPGFTGFA